MAIPTIGGNFNTMNDGMDGTTVGQINALTAKATVIDADLVLIEDSAASFAKKKTTFTVIKEWIQDWLATFIVQGTNMTITYDDTANTLTFDAGSGYTTEQAQDAVGAMINSSLVYTDATPLLERAALTGAITAAQGSNTTALGSFTLAELDTAVSDASIVDLDNAQTLTNKRIDPRVQSVTSSATVTPDANANDVVVITAQAAGLTLANPTGTPVQGQPMLIRLKDNGTARAITWGSQYRGIGAALLSTTTISKTTYFTAIYNSTDTKWDVVYNTEV